jgi:hypothetical protein
VRLQQDQRRNDDQSFVVLGRKEGTLDMSEAVEQPLFALMGDDPIAPPMVNMWACFKNGDLAGALGEFNHIAQEIAPMYEDAPAPEDVVQGAVACAEAMQAWQEG